MATTIHSADLTQIRQIQEKLAEVNKQANSTQDVSGDDKRLADIANSLQIMQSNYASDGTARATIARMLGDVQNLQGLARETTGKSNATSNASWEGQMNDLAALLEDAKTTSTFSEPRTSTGAHIGTTVIGDELTALQGTQAGSSPETLTRLANGTLVGDDPVSKKYTLYDSAGKKTASFPYSAAHDNVIDLGTGQAVILSDQGIAGSWLTNDAAGHKKTEANKKVFKAGETIRNSPDLPGLLKNNNNAVQAMGTIPERYMLWDDVCYKMFDQDGQQLPSGLNKELTSPMTDNYASVQFAIGLGDGKWFATDGKGFSNASIVSDITKSPLYNKDLQTFTLEKDGSVKVWDKPPT